MSGESFFAKPCPACGRTAQILVRYLGKQVCCKHCGREFAATDPESISAAEMDPVNYWIHFTETLYRSDLDPCPDANRYPR